MFTLPLEIDAVSEILSKTAQSSLMEKLIVVAVVWFIMGKKVAEHFKGLENGMANGFKKVTEELLEIRLALTRVETDHSSRLNKIEDNINQFDGRIEKLEEGVSDVRPNPR